MAKCNTLITGEQHVSLSITSGQALLQPPD